MKITISQRTDYHQLYSIISQNISNTKVHLEISKFMEPVDILIITKFLIYQLGNHCQISISVSDGSLKRYLDAIGIIDFCNNNFEISNTMDAISSGTAMPIKRVSAENIHSYIENTKLFLAEKCPTKDLGGLNTSIAELINNVYDHSNSPIDAYVFCQLYPRINEIKIAVSDLGIGIPIAVNSYLNANGLPLLSASEAIEWALTFMKTIKSHPQNQGRGLDTVNSFISANRSYWSIYSGEIKMTSGVWGRTFNPNPIKNFIGTVIELVIKINNLEDKEQADYLVQEPWSW